MRKLTKTAIIIVTYNRIDLLINLLDSIFKQTYPVKKIVICDNSNDKELSGIISEYNEIHFDKIKLLIPSENLGGAGGFNLCLKYAMEIDIDRFWLMDDDAVLHQHAHAAIIQYANNDYNTYCSIAVSTEDYNTLCWPPHNNINNLVDLDEINEFKFAPFIGFLIHRKTVEQIGYPFSHFFISGDDYEYSLRVNAINKSIFWVRNSLIYHPKIQRKVIKFFRFSSNHLIMPPWRRYYDVRNRIISRRIHFGTTNVFLTLLSLLFHYILTIIYEKEKFNQTISYISGLYHGLNFDINLFNYKD